ncbi:MAG TPA: hypothetical protein VF119_04500 [Candidatus Limnocylindrales bacterium]
MSIERLRPVWVGLTVVILALAAIEAVVLFQVIDDQDAVGVDLVYFRSIAQRWLDTGVWYTADQLAGPYQVETLVTNLYPPHALYLFVPFLALPAILWWVVPLGTIAYVVWWCRPAAWAWPIFAAIVLFPKTLNQIIYGNTDMWIAAFIAGGVRWAWPATLVTIKPSLLFFAAIGILRRSWWIAAFVLAVLSLPLIGLWLQYPTVMLNSSAKFWYSFGNLPFFVLPLVAWIGSTRRGDTPWVPWVHALLGRAGAP